MMSCATSRILPWLACRTSSSSSTTSRSTSSWATQPGSRRLPPGARRHRQHPQRAERHWTPLVGSEGRRTATIYRQPDDAPNLTRGNPVILRQLRERHSVFRERPDTSELRCRDLGRPSLGHHALRLRPCHGGLLDSGRLDLLVAHGRHRRHGNHTRRSGSRLLGWRRSTGGGEGRFSASNLRSWFEEGLGSFANSSYLLAIIMRPVCGQMLPPGKFSSRR